MMSPPTKGEPALLVYFEAAASTGTQLGPQFMHTETSNNECTVDTLVCKV